MVILHIACLSNNKFAGPNINVPKNIIYGNKYEDVALLNYNNEIKIDKIKDYKVYKINEYKTIENLPEPFDKPDIVVFQGLYIPMYCKLAKKLNRNNIPYVIVPRCSMTTNSQNKSKIKKIIGNLLMFKKFIKNASAINFLTENEYHESKKFKFKNYFINGNGVEMPNKVRTYNKNNDEFVVNYIGRVEWFHKGLDVLIESINLGKEEFRNRKFKFNLYGPDREKSVQKLMNLIEKYQISDLIEIKEAVYDDDKEKVLLNTDLFIHTSRLEGQPTAVIEAISYGVPVFVTPGTNILDIVNENGLGFVSEFDINEIKNNLLIAYDNKNKFEEITKREIEYARNNFDWDSIVKKNIEEYKKIII